MDRRNPRLQQVTMPMSRPDAESLDHLQQFGYALLEGIFGAQAGHPNAEV